MQNIHFYQPCGFLLPSGMGQHRGEERVLIIYEYFFGEQEKPTPPFHVNMEKCAPCVLQGGSISKESYAPES